MKKKILIVDDEKEMVALLKERLDPFYNVLTAFDGVAGYEAAVREVPHLILLDIRMPKRNGYDVLTDIRKNEITRKIPVVMLSTVAETNSIYLSQDLGMSDYLIKPVHLENLPELVRHYTED